MSAPDAALSAYRSATNLRTVQRNDPAVLAILDTSVYSTIYHYDEGAGRWVKQKQEGSLFVVRRDKAPEHALFLLNRINVKNVTIPLIPGEMKVTVMEGDMMQVARRREKIRYGIWFSEGIDCIKRFRETIVGICGEPSAIKTSSPAPHAASPAPAPGPASGALQVGAPAMAGMDGGDDLARLFANALKQVSVPPAPPTQVTTTTTTTRTVTASAPAPGPAPQLPSMPSARPPVSPPAFAPGQTAEDLLNSILGVAPAAPSAPSPAAPPALPASQPHAPTPPPHAAPLAHAPSRSPLPAQRTAQQSPALPSLPVQQQHALSPLAAHAAPRPPGADPAWAGGAPPYPVHANGHASPAPPLHMNGHPAGAPPFAPQPLPLPFPLLARDAAADAMPVGIHDKDAFAHALRTLVQHDPVFMDAAWAAYNARLGRPPG